MAPSFPGRVLVLLWNLMSKAYPCFSWLSCLQNSHQKGTLSSSCHTPRASAAQNHKLFHSLPQNSSKGLGTTALNSSTSLNTFFSLSVIFLGITANWSIKVISKRQMLWLTIQGIVHYGGGGRSRRWLAVLCPWSGNGKRLMLLLNMLSLFSFSLGCKCIAWCCSPLRKVFSQLT